MLHHINAQIIARHARFMSHRFPRDPPARRTIPVSRPVSSPTPLPCRPVRNTDRLHMIVTSVEVPAGCYGIVIEELVRC